MTQTALLSDEQIQRILFAAYDLLSAVEQDPATLDTSHPSVMLAAGRLRAEVGNEQLRRTEVR